MQPPAGERPAAGRPERYLAEYIERMGTGTLDMIGRCIDEGLPEPQPAVTDGFVTTDWRAIGVARAVSGA